MSVVLPLPCYPYPVTPQRVAAIKEAKEYLVARDSIDFKVQLCEAVPASPGRILAFGPPPFLCLAGAAMVRSLEPEKMRAYVEYVLDEDFPGDGIELSAEAWFSHALGAPVKEVTHKYSGADFYAMEQAREDARERGVRFGDD